MSPNSADSEPSPRDDPPAFPSVGNGQPRKNEPRLGLFGKLNEARKRKAASRSEHSPEHQEVGHQEVGLANTQVQPSLDSSTMRFTYSAGSTPLPRYTIRRGVGMGGFGEVYFAVSDAGKEVALKRIQRNLEIELRGVSHCLNLKHNHLVSLYDVCRDDQDQSWVVMEYVAGPNLRQVLDDSPQGLSVNETMRWFSAIASGVDHLHGAGLVHRDLKPANVFDDLGTVKVGDYGLSKFISATHRGGHTESVGTFHYMAPEIGNGQYGRQIDIYAMGIILFEMLTGRVPFDGESSQEIIVKHLTALPDLTDIPEQFRPIIAKCLDKDPGARYEHVHELVEALSVASPSAASPTKPLVATSPAPNVSETPESLRTEPFDQDIEPVEAAASPPRSSVSGSSAGSSSDNASGATAGEWVHHPASSEEPVSRAVRSLFADLGRWWHSLDQSPGSKSILLIAACVVVLINTHWLLPLLSLVAMVYLPYYVIRQMVLPTHPQPTYAQAHREANACRVPQPKPITKAQRRQQARSQLRAKPKLNRAAELNVSWVAALVCVFLLGMVSGLVGLRNAPINPIAVAPYVWAAAVVMFASMCLLGLGKLWESSDGESLTRRFVLGGVGAIVGAVAFAMSRFLLLEIDQGLTRDIDASRLPRSLYGADGPTLAAFMAHFGILFAALRWWKPVDPLRRTRLSLWAVAVAVVGQWAVHQVMPIPHPWGMLIVGGIAIVVQMSAPWIDPRRSNASTPVHAVAWRPTNKETDPNYAKTGGPA